MNWHQLPPDEIPPRWMWPFSDAINDWFQERNYRMTRDAKDAGDTRVKVPLNENQDPRMIAYRRGKDTRIPTPVGR